MASDHDPYQRHLFFEHPDNGGSAKLPQDKLRFLKEVINSVPAPIFFKDRNTLFQGCNSAFLKLFCLTREEVVGKTTFELFPEEFARRNHAVDQRLFRREVPEERYETTVVRDDASQRQVVIHKAWLDLEGGGEGIVGVIIDITERKQAEKALLESQTLLQRVFENIPDLLSVVDREFRIQASNWHGGFEYVPEHLRVDHPRCHEVYYPDQGSFCQPCHLEEVFRTGKVVTREKRNSKIGDLEIRAFPVCDENNQVVLAAEYIRDISHRKAAEAMLRESEQQMRRITDNMLDIVSEADHEGIFRYLSPSHRAVLGFDPETLIGTCLYELMHPEDLERMRELFQVTLPQLQSVRAEFRYRHADGHYLWLETVGKCTLDAQRNTNGAVFASRDISERRRAEDGLREVHQTLQTTIQASPLAIVVLDNHACVKLWNPAAESMFGWTRAEVMGRPYPLITPTREGESLSSLEGIDHGECFHSIETRYRRKDGQLLHISCSRAPLHELDGPILGSVSVLADITERKRSETALKESEANYRAIFDAANDAIFVLDIDTGAILDINRKLCEIYGYSRSQLLRLPIEAVSAGIPPYTQENALAWIHLAVDGRSRVFEWKARKKSGALFWVEVTMKGAMIGGSYRALAVVRDISERKRAEAALKESEERFRQIFEQNEDPAFLLEPYSLTIFDANSAVSTLYGYSKAELLSTGIGLLMDPGELAALAEKLAGGQQAELKKKSWSHISALETLDQKGKTVIVSFRGKIIRSQGIPYIYCTLRDITEKLRLRDERNELQAKLLHTNKMTAIGTLASGIAHEINNPNNYIMSNAQFLNDTWQDLQAILEKHADEYGTFSLGGLPYQEALESIPILLAGISEGARRIRNIVTNLKDFARQEECTENRCVDVNQAINAALVILSNKIQKHTDHFFCTLRPDLPHIMGKFQKIEQVIINLVLNALQSLPGRQLGIYLSTSYNAAQKRVLIKIRDQGVGIPEDIKCRIMDPFFTTRHKTGGTGLGLSICYVIINDHKGTIDFKSEVGKGTTVTLSLPVL